MWRIRNLLLTVFWALLGPILVGVLLALLLGRHGYPTHSWRFLVQAIESNLLAAHGWFYIQIGLGVTYGICRHRLGPVSLGRGILAATIVWSVVGSLLLLLLLGEPDLFSGGWCGGPPPTWWEQVGVPLAWVMGHIVGGAIAGFHVEYHLLRNRRFAILPTPIFAEDSIDSDFDG